MNRILFVFLILTQLLLLSSCAVSQRQATEKLHTLVKTSSLDEAIKFAESKDFYNEKNSQLIKLVETGMLYHLKGDYIKSTQTFEQAKQLSDDLYTVSISKKIKSLMTNGNSDNYYGERFERSLIRLYLALDYFMIFQTGGVDITQKDRQDYLSKARASILDWDSMLSSLQSETDGNSVYKNDVSAKIIGAFIHEQMGSRSDLQIAKQLYQDVKTVLVKNYSGYPSFNSIWDEYKKNYDKFPKLGMEEVRKSYIKATKYFEQLESFVDKRIAKLAGQDQDHIKIIFEHGLIAKKIAKQFDFPLPMANIPYLPGGGMGPAEFVARALSSGVAIPTISFELPAISEHEYKKDFYVVFRDAKKSEVLREPIYLINPISDLASEALGEKIGSIKSTVGMRVALKHAVALSAAYATYKQLAGRSSNSELLAYAVAIASYAAANKAIRASEQADIRSWSLLPDGIYFGSYQLPSGTYELSIISQTFKGPEVVEKVIPSVNVDSSKINFYNIK